MRYPIATLYGDYIRSAVGLVLTAVPLLLLDLAHGVALLLAALGLLFAWFGARTVLRHLSRVELSGNAIALRGPIARRVAWADLDAHEARLLRAAPSARPGLAPAHAAQYRRRHDPA